MADILFASGKYELSQDASLKLARLSGVILAHPGLKLRIEGYTDTTGSEAFNFTLSGQASGCCAAVSGAAGTEAGRCHVRGNGPG